MRWLEILSSIDGSGSVICSNSPVSTDTRNRAACCFTITGTMSHLPFGDQAGTNPIRSQAGLSQMGKLASFLSGPPSAGINISLALAGSNDSQKGDGLAIR